MKQLLISLTILCTSLKILGQISITAPSFSYTETFGSLTPIAWVNNTSFPGWYYTGGTYQGSSSITAAAPSNNGGLYNYQFGVPGDLKLGARASGGTGTVRYGLRLKNNTGFAINSIQVSFDFFQLSLSENGGNINTVNFSYLVAATANNLLAGGYTSVPGLSFSQIISSAICGGSQLNGYPGTQSGSKAATCIPVTIPIGGEIMLMWSDVDDACNDNHMAIDNVSVTFFTNNTVNPNIACSVLPVTLTDFYAELSDREIALKWLVSDEKNLAFYILEKSTDGVNYTSLATVYASSNRVENRSTYTKYDYTPTGGINYYRLKSVNNDGSINTHKVIALDYKNSNAPKIWLHQHNQMLKIGYTKQSLSKSVLIFDIMGRLVKEVSLNPEVSSEIELSESDFEKGVFLIYGANPNDAFRQKFIVQ